MSQATTTSINHCYSSQKWLQTSPVCHTTGAHLLNTIDSESDRLNLLSVSLQSSKELQQQQQQQNKQQQDTENSTTSTTTSTITKLHNSALELESTEYRSQLLGIQGILSDALMSAVHREICHYHLNHQDLAATSAAVSQSNNNDDTTEGVCDKKKTKKTVAVVDENRLEPSAHIPHTRKRKWRHPSMKFISSASSINNSTSSNNNNNNNNNFFSLRIANDEDESHIVNDPSADETDEEDEENNDNMMDDQQDDGQSDTNSQTSSSGVRTGSKQQHSKNNHNSKNNNNSNKNQNNNNKTSSSSKNDNTASSSSSAATKEQQAAQKAQKRRDEFRKKKQEDEQLLTMKRVRSSEKSVLLATLGPFPLPRLTIRALKYGKIVPSRKTLTQRLNMEQILESSSSSSTDEEERDQLQQAASSSPPEKDDQATVKKLMQFLSPLSMESLKKIADNTKTRLRPNIPHEKALDEITRVAIRSGCYEAYHILEKAKVPEKVTTSDKTSQTHLLQQLTNNTSSFLNSAKPDTLKLLGPPLGIPADTVTAAEIWERIIAIGLASVIAHTPPRTLRKIGQEVSVTLQENLSSEKQVNQIVSALFPRERLRNRYARKLRRAPGISFSATPNKTKTFEDMGFIGFTIHNVSHMKEDQGERHYSPEFEYGNLRWSLLCMCNKESLALYLCQQGSVHCKFVISVVNNKNTEDSIFNEGTQEFKHTSTENDWGFNNVIKFDQLLDPRAGYWDQEGDLIRVELGIVLVDGNPKNAENNNNIASATADENNNSNKASAAGSNKSSHNNNKGSNNNHHEPSTLVLNNNDSNKSGKKDQNNNNNHHHNNINSKSSKEKKKELEAKQAAEVAEQLLEQERLEALRKRIKQQFSKLHNEEEKLRKDINSKSVQEYQRLCDQSKKDEQRITREAQEREKREQLERQREQEKLRVLQEQHQEFRRRLTDLTNESAEIATKKKSVASETAELKTSTDAKRKELAKADKSLEPTRSRVEELRQRLAEKRARLEEVKAAIEAKPILQDDESTQELAEDSEILKSVQKSLAGIIDF